MAEVSGETGNPLSPCEIEALRLLAGGLTPKQAANRLGISGTALSMRVNRASTKLGTNTTTQLVLHAHCKGYLARTSGGT